MILTINENGMIKLDAESFRLLLKASKCNSKKYRHIKKAIKKVLMKALKDAALRSEEKSSLSKPPSGQPG